MAIPHSVMQTLAALIIDGVLDRFPRLKFGAIELGASWLPGWMRSMDSAPRGLLQERGAAAPAVGASPARSCAGRCASRPIRTRTPAGSSATAGEEMLPVLLRLPARRGRPQSAQAVRRRRWPGLPRERGRRLLLRQLHRPDGRGPGERLTSPKKPSSRLKALHMRADRNQIQCP